jgi:hypothetical protein
LASAQGLRRRVDVASLLEPDVPGRADARRIGDLLASQADGAPALARDDAEVGWIEALAPAAQEVRELVAPRLVERHGAFCTRITAPLLPAQQSARVGQANHRRPIDAGA